MDGAAHLVALAQNNGATLAQLMHAQFAAGAHGAARSAWIEINRPLTALCLNAPLVPLGPQPIAGNAAGAIITTPTASMPIGMDIKSITCTQGDIDSGWVAINFTFGTLNLVNPQGTGPGINLSMFSPFLEHVDRLAPWILSKTKVDVQVTAQMQYLAPTGALPALFHGFSINAFQEEQVCAIQTRIEPTDRNVGNAELINLFRHVTGAAAGVNPVMRSSLPIQGGAFAQAAPQFQVSPRVVSGFQQMLPVAQAQYGRIQ